MKKHDPELYKSLTQPRPESDARQAIDSFMEDLYELRKKHGICDVTVVAVAAAQTEHGSVATVSHFGNSANALPMAATAFRYYRTLQDDAALAMAGIAVEGVEDK